MVKRTVTVFILFVFSLLFFASYSHSALYKWIDKDGQPHITDYPDPSKAPTRDEHVQQPVSPYREEPPQETAPMPQPPGKEDLITEPPKEISPPPAITQQPKPQIPAAPPALPKAIPAPKEIPEPPIGIAYICIILLAMYFYASLCLYLIAKKLSVPSPVLAWIPLIQVWTFVVSAKGTGGHPCLWVLSMAIPVVGPLIGIYLWMCIAENLGKNKWLALLMLIPLVGFGFMGWLAFSKGETGGEKALASNI
jgi:hypothetical protein